LIPRCRARRLPAICLLWRIRFGLIQNDERRGGNHETKKLKKIFRPDFVCLGLIVVEIKAVSALNDQHRSQVHNYLRATNFELGLLVIFGTTPKLQYERIVR
jgi:GxxExxY protein